MLVNWEHLIVVCLCYPLGVVALRLVWNVKRLSAFQKVSFLVEWMPMFATGNMWFLAFALTGSLCWNLPTPSGTTAALVIYNVCYDCMTLTAWGGIFTLVWVTVKNAKMTKFKGKDAV